MGQVNPGLKDSFSHIEDMSFDEIYAHPTFQASIKDQFDQREIVLSQSGSFNFETADELLADEGSREAVIEATVRTAVSIGIENYAEASEDANVQYRMGAKAGGAGGIDCSGFVSKAIQHAMGGVRDGVNIEASDLSARASFNDNVLNAVKTSSEYQIHNLGKDTGILADSEVTTENIRAGMVIGMDTGPKNFDRGRPLGIDHVVITYRDTETGKMMVAQSSSSGGGVNTMPLDDYEENGETKDGWLTKARERGHTLYGVDVVQLAEVDIELKRDVVPEPDVVVAQADADPNLSDNQTVSDPIIKEEDPFTGPPAPAV